MDGLNQISVIRGYSSILLEEIALEGLDGITLDGECSTAFSLK